jgi:PKD repeat protein
VCGNGQCEAGENNDNCPTDCTAGCGNAVCDAGEDCANCARDCALRPAFSMSPSPALVGQDVTFTADPALIVDPSPKWDLGNGAHLEGNPLVYRYPAPGRFRVLLTATEGNCGTAQVSDPQFIDVFMPFCEVDGFCNRAAGENEAGCPQDCTPTLGCGDGTCGGGEDCTTCARDCALKPTFTISNLAPEVGDDIVFTADASRIADPDPSWDLGNGVHLRGNPLVYRYPGPGTFRIVLTATESRCGTTQLSEPQFLQVVDVGHACPREPQPSCGNGQCETCESVNCPGDCLPTCGNRTCDAEESCSNCSIDCGFRPAFSFSPASPVQVGEEITFTAEPALISDPNPSWDLGNGVHIQGRSVVYSYPAPGTYNVVLTATEANCSTTQTSLSQRIEVRERAVRRGDYAEVVSSNLPACLKPGATFNAIITMRNAGSTAWDVGYNLGAVGDADPFAASTRVGLSRPVLPLETHTFTFTLTAPPVAGLYVSDWQMVHEGVAWFGEATTHLISVSNDCTTPIGQFSYSCNASVQNASGFPVPDVEVTLDAYVVEPDAPPRAVSHGVGQTDRSGRASITVTSAGPIQQLVCEAHGIRTTTPRSVFATDPVMVPDKTVLALNLTTVPDFVDRATFVGLKHGTAVGRLYQSGPYDKPVVIPSPFDAKEQTGERRTEATFYQLFEPFIVLLNSFGFDVWLIKTQTGQNIHEQAAEFAQAIDFAAKRVGPEAKVIVAGYSLGGVAARLSTARYEADAEWRAALGVRDALPVNLIIFGDAPLAGAHINLCLQEGIWELPGERLPSAAAESNLNTCGAQQLLQTSVSGLGGVQSHSTNWQSFYERGEPVYLIPSGVCDRQGIAPNRRTPDPDDGVAACVCDPGPALFSVNGDGFAHGPGIIAFSDGNAGPMMCYGDARDEGRDGVRVCKPDPSVPTPFEVRLGDVMYKVRLPAAPDPPLCRAQPEDIEGGSRLSGDITKVVRKYLFFAGGVEQYINGTFIPHRSALPPGAPFFDTRDNSFQGVHGTGYDDIIRWVLQRMVEASR